MGPLPDNWPTARMADLTPDLQVSLSRGSIAESFHSLQSLSVSCFQVILGHPGPCFPTICMSKAVLTAPLERSTCPYPRNLLSFRMRSRSSIPSRASSSVDLMMAVSCGLTLQGCLIIALSFRCRCWRLGFVNGQVNFFTKYPILKEIFYWGEGLMDGQTKPRPICPPPPSRKNLNLVSSKLEACLFCVRQKNPRSQLCQRSNLALSHVSAITYKLLKLI